MLVASVCERSVFVSRNPLLDISDTPGKFDALDNLPNTRKMSKPRKAFGGGGMLSQQAAMIGKAPAKRPTDSTLLEPGNPPSPAGSMASTTSRDGPPSAKKRRKNDPRTPVLTVPTPAETGLGQSMLSLKSFAVEYLKSMKGDPQLIDSITDHLSIRDEDRKRELAMELRTIRTISYMAPEGSTGTDADWRLGTYSYLAKLPRVKDKTSLLQYLQKRTDSQGVPVKDIKDGWPDCDKALTELEKGREVLVTRTKKDGQARHVWPNDPSLYHTSPGDEVAVKWHKVPLPGTEDMYRELTKEGLTPSTQERRGDKISIPRQERKKPSRRSMKQTNTHLQGILKDYKHLGKRAT